MNTTTIMATGEFDKIVCLKMENESLQFVGFVKSNISMTPEMHKIANVMLSKLYDTWSQNYDRINCITHDSEFRYESLKNLFQVSWKVEKNKLIDTQKAYMSITAICNFTKNRKAFWINTGSDMAYVSREGEPLEKLCTRTKKLKDFKEQSIFSITRDYCLKAEGSIITNYQKLYIVSADAVEYFEESGYKITQKSLDDFSFKKQNPIIIGQISASN